MQQEAVFVFTGQCVNTLGITLGAEGRYHQRLGLTAGEKGRAMGAGQHAVADLDRTHGTGIASVDARLAGQDLAANDAGFDVEQHAFDLDGVEFDTGFGTSYVVNSEGTQLRYADDLLTVRVRCCKGDGDVSVCFFGDGTTNIGAFHEALNFAVVWKLPVIFVCENNHYMEYTPIGEVTAVASPAGDRAAAYGLPKIVIDGNDADEVYRTARAAYDKARKGEGPSLIECITYRHSGHSRADPAKYRPEGELEKWKERDPVKLYRTRLAEFGIDPAVMTGIESGVRREVDEATEKCKASPAPSMELLTTDVYADGGFAWRN